MKKERLRYIHRRLWMIHASQWQLSSDVGAITILCGITILCLQDASLLSVNSIVPVILMFVGFVLSTREAASLTKEEEDSL